jgi:protein TonB
MTSVLTVKAESGPTGYGRDEIKKSFHRNYVRGMIFSIAIHAVIIGSYYLGDVLGSDDDNIPMVKVRKFRYSDLGPPPSISQAPAPPSVSVQAVVKPTIGMPVPVPDAEVSPEQTIATQQELSSTPSPVLEEFGKDGNAEISPDITIDEDPAMDAFIPYEKGPEIVKKVIPKYPEMALRAGLEGTVWVKILVDKDGKPKKAVVIKSTVEILNDAAVEAAMQFVFTPAVMNNGAVRVWVAIPFRFYLRDVQSM